jgi:hypothetical protein
MVFIELVRVSEILAPHKFDRSTLNSIDLLFDRSTLNSIDLLFDRSTLKSIDLLFQHFRKSSFSMYFVLKIVILLLLPCKNAKTLKLTKTLESNKAKGLTNVN